MRFNRRNDEYITVPRRPVKPEWVEGVSTEELLASEGTKVAALGSVAITLRLDQVIDSVRGKSADPVSALVVGFGDVARATLRACRDGGARGIAMATKDKAETPWVRVASDVVWVADSFDQALYENAYAVLKAAEEANSKVILLVDGALASDATFLAVAKEEGRSVYRLMTPAAPKAAWSACEADAAGAAPVWRTCKKCGLVYDRKTLSQTQGVCPSCGGYFRLTSAERFADVLDEGTFVEWDARMPVGNPLDFPGYEEKLSANREKSGLEEGVRCGEGRIAGLRVAVCAMDSTFMMGSMGSVVGEKVTRAVERATESGLPFIAFTASGGARMQEGLLSLMQMAKISAALSRHAEAGLLYVSVLTDPTTGGVTASFAMQGDIILAEPGALIGFAGQRVIRDTIGQELPEGFQTAEFALEHGLIDAIVERSEMRATLANIVALHEATGTRCVQDDGDPITFALVRENLTGSPDASESVHYGVAGHVKRVLSASERKKRRIRPLQAFKALAKRAEGAACAPRHEGTDALACGEESVQGGFDAMVSDDNPAWRSVQLARNVHRPTALHYVNGIVDGFVELHGDRAFGDDGAIVAGIGWIGTQPVTVIAQEKGADLKERIRRHFGCPEPEGYRKSLRLMRQAAKFGRPIVCFVDTQGAFCGMEAEERGQGNAIADNLIAMAGLDVPIVSVLLGEGGSGGALALAVADRVAMQEHAVYSVLSPEGFASILWKDRTRAPEAAAVMKMSAAEACEAGVVEAVISEGEGPAHENPDQALAHVRGWVVRTLDELVGFDKAALLEGRYRRFRKF